MRSTTRLLTVSVLAVSLALASGCAGMYDDSGRMTARDKTKKGAGYGAAAGAILGAILGEGEADEILAGAAIGAGIGAGVGTYMDRQEEKLARIPGTTVERIDDDMLLVHFDSDLLFAIDSASLTAESRRSLDEASTVLQQFDKTAVITQGHTDSTGSEAHNQALSERRARAVANHLVMGGISNARIVSMGYGEMQPVADNSTNQGRERNRRVDLLIKGKAK